VFAHFCAGKQKAQAGTGKHRSQHQEQRYWQKGKEAGKNRYDKRRVKGPVHAFSMSEILKNIFPKILLRKPRQGAGEILFEQIGMSTKTIKKDFGMRLIDFVHQKPVIFDMTLSVAFPITVKLVGTAAYRKGLFINNKS
jgi:hypothetical protein